MCRISCQQLVLLLGTQSRMASLESRASHQKLRLDLLLSTGMNHSRITLCTPLLAVVRPVLCSQTRFWKITHLAYSKRIAVQCNTI